MPAGITTTTHATHSVEITAESGRIPSGLACSWGRKPFQITSLSLRWENKGAGWVLESAFVAGPVVLASGKLSTKNHEIRDFAKLRWDDEPVVPDAERLNKFTPAWVKELVAEFAPGKET